MTLGDVSIGAVPIGATDAGLDLRTLELLPDGVVVCDRSGRVVEVTARATVVARLDPRDAVGRPLAEVLPLLDDEGRSWWAHTAPFSGPASRTRQPERLLALPGVGQVHVSASYVRTADAARDLLAFVVMLRPATERSRRERQAAELVATAAHELRSPLTSVKGFTTTLLAKWDRFSDEQRRLMLETVVADADRLTRLIVELLDVARIDSGRVRLNRAWVDVVERTRWAVGVVTTAGAAPERFAVEVRGDPARVWADADKVDQILLNLLENAVRHGEGTTSVVVEPAVVARTAGGPGDGGSAILDAAAPDGSRPGATTDAVEAARPGGVEGAGPISGQDGSEPAVSVSVSDEGPGIPEHLVARAFHKYWHTGVSGNGLGLYIVRGMVEAHGGSIAVDRAEQGGARFRFLLPVGQPGLPA